jgi:hypothetical protein
MAAVTGTQADCLNAVSSGNRVRTAFMNPIRISILAGMLASQLQAVARYQWRQALPVSRQCACAYSQPRLCAHVWCQ